MTRDMTDGATPLHLLCEALGNQIWVKRDDLYPLSLGGNKARKAALFFREIDDGGFDHVVTYGSGHSNHCRVVASCCSMRGLGCTLISPSEASESTYNSALCGLCGARTVTVPVDQVHDTIEQVVAELAAAGKRSYFIAGGGHGDIGTQAYVDCYEEVLGFERTAGITFDEVFLASGTGTTQAGLVCGSLLRGDGRRIVGISVARPCPRGRDVVVESACSYLRSMGVDVSERDVQRAVDFDDSFVGAGYASASEEVDETIREAWVRYGLPLDRTYTGKAFYGMLCRLKAKGTAGKRILFIHTGGTPLFFDDLPLVIGG